MDGQIQMQLGTSGSSFLPPFFSLCASHTLSSCTPASYTDGNLPLPGSARLSSSVLVSKISGKSSDWPSLGQLSNLNRSTVAKRTRCKKHGGSLKSLGLELGEGKRKTFPQKMGDICSQKREKTTYQSLVLPRMKANKAFKSEVKWLLLQVTPLWNSLDISIQFNINWTFMVCWYYVTSWHVMGSLSICLMNNAKMNKVGKVPVPKELTT